MLIRISGKRDQTICGEILYASLKEPVAFTGIGQMIIRMEEICDLEGLAPSDRKPEFLNERMLSSLDEKELQNGKSKVLFVADICSRGNYSMQGTVRGPLTGGKYVRFRSALELMRMIDAVDV